MDDLILLPALVPYATLAVSCLNPLTAWRLLNDFEYLKEGDIIIQNAANSAVGLSCTICQENGSYLRKSCKNKRNA